MLRDTCGEKEDLLVTTRVGRRMVGTSGGSVKYALDQWGEECNVEKKEGTERKNKSRTAVWVELYEGDVERR